MIQKRKIKEQLKNIKKKVRSKKIKTENNSQDIS